MSETDLSRAIRKAIGKLGVPCVRVQSGGRVGRIKLAASGTPDLWTPLCWLEVKMPAGKVSDVQRAWHETMASWGVRVHVVRSVEEAVRAVSAELEAFNYERAQGWR